MDQTKIKLPRASEHMRIARLHVARGIAAMRNGHIQEAKEACELALTFDDNLLEAYLTLARIRYPGDTYLDVLSAIQSTIKPKNYVEIGVSGGLSLARCLPETRCIGIDPEPKANLQLHPNTRIFVMKSKDCFRKYDLKILFDCQLVDLAFIDGMHTFDTVLYELMHLELACSRDGAILIHDCLPYDQKTATRNRKTRFWTGDVWRALCTITRFRPDLSVSVIECAPSGLAVIRNLNPHAVFSESSYHEMVRFGINLCFDDRAIRTSENIRFYPSDWNKICPLFASVE